MWQIQKWTDHSRNYRYISYISWIFHKREQKQELENVIIQVDQYNVKRHKKLQSCTFFLLNELTMKGEVGQRDTIKEAITNKSFLN